MENSVHFSYTRQKRAAWVGDTPGETVARKLVGNTEARVHGAAAGGVIIPGPNPAIPSIPDRAV